MKKLNKRGFTIVELVVVIAVIAILAGVLIPSLSGVVGKANDSKALSEARNAYTQYLIAHPTAEIDYVKNAAGTIYDVNDGFKVVTSAATGKVTWEVGTCLETNTGSTCVDCKGSGTISTTGTTTAVE